MKQAFFLVAVMPAICHADCGQFFGYQRVVVRQVQPVYHAVQAVKYVAPVAAYTSYNVATPHYYAVGQGLQDQAERERIERNAVNIYKEGLSDGLKVAGGNGAQAINQRAQDSVIAVKCGKCHGSAIAAPKAGLFFDAGVQYEPRTIVRSLAILSGIDVPEGMKSVVAGLSPEDKGKLMSELLQAEKK